MMMELLLLLQGSQEERVVCGERGGRVVERMAGRRGHGVVSWNHVMSTGMRMEARPGHA